MTSLSEFVISPLFQFAQEGIVTFDLGLQSILGPLQSEVRVNKFAIQHRWSLQLASVSLIFLAPSLNVRSSSAMLLWNSAISA